MRNDSSDNQGRGSRDCFIATAVYGDTMAPEVVALRQFRDDTLQMYWLGKKFIKAYYKVSPPIADWLQTKPRLSHMVRSLLNQLVGWIQ